MYIEEEEIYIFKIKRNKNNFLLIMKRRKRKVKECFEDLRRREIFFY